MKKILMILSLITLSGCYSAYPPAQDVYVETYNAPGYYADSVQTVYVTQPSTTYVIEQNSPDVIYIDSAPDYVYLPNPLIYGRYHHHPVYHHYSRGHYHGHHVSHSPHHGGHKPLRPTHGHNDRPSKPHK